MKVKNQLIVYASSHKMKRLLGVIVQIILGWTNGLTYTESEKKNQISEPAIAKWRKRFELVRDSVLLFNLFMCRRKANEIC